MNRVIAVTLIIIISLWTIRPALGVFAAAAVEPAEGLIMKFVGDPVVKLVPLASGEDGRERLRQLSAYDVVEYVELNRTYRAALIPNDPLFPDQWSLSRISAPEAWGLTTGSASVIVAVLDTGVDIDHPDLSAALAVNASETAGNGVDDDGNGFIDDVVGWDFVTNLADPSPKFTGSETVGGTHHGTIVSGIAAAVGNNGIGVAGVAWGVKLLPVRVLDGAGVGDTFTVAQGIDYAIQRGAKVINLSFAGSASSKTLDDAIARARSAGAVVVAAAGNDGFNLDENPQYPVCTSGVIGVAALTQADERASFSNYGRTCIDVAAPGENMTSTAYEDANRGYADAYQGGWFGTSIAAPLVSGVAALVASAHPSFSLAQLEEALIGSAASLKGDALATASLGAGRLDAAAALGSSPSFVHHDVVTFPGSTGGPQVRRFNGEGAPLGQFFAADKTSRSGGSIAAGDLDGDRVEEVVVSDGAPHNTRIRIVRMSGERERVIEAFSRESFGAVNVAAGDLDADGDDEIVASLSEGPPTVRIIDGRGKLIREFLAYGKGFRGGVTVAVADLNADGRAEIITGTVTGAPQVRIFSGLGKAQSQFFAYSKTFRGGVRVAAIR